SGMFLSDELPGSPLSSSPAARMRHRAAHRTAMTIIMRVATPFIDASAKDRIKYGHHHRAAVITSIHADVTSHTARQDRHQRNFDANFDSVNRAVALA